MVGLEAEAVIARRLGCPVAVGGGGYAGALAATQRLVAEGATMLVSFGLAGGLRPGLAAGSIVVPRWVVGDDGARHATDDGLARRLGPAEGVVLASRDIIGTAAAKALAWRATQADAADIETSAVVAGAGGRPFAVLRSVCDPAERDLPPAALAALDAEGRIGLGGILLSVARDPRQIGSLVALGRDAAAARKALTKRVLSIGSALRAGF